MRGSLPALLAVALASLRYRIGSVALAIASVSVSVFVLLGIEHVRQEAKSSFSQTVSGVDLIVGARTGQLNLLLYSVFRIGSPTSNMSWESYRQLINRPEVAWAVPLSLGDSHRGYRVVGTTGDYFAHYRYGRDRKLVFREGERFVNLFDVVIGSEVAKRLNYGVGDSLVLAHGLAATSFRLHDEKPFTVTGILRPTGTPVDNALYVSLEAIEAIHQNPNNGTLSAQSLQPQSITATLVGLKSKMATFIMQRRISESHQEPLVAILPGVALTELWQMVGAMEGVLRSLSVLIFASALVGLAAMLLASMRERKAELVIMRTMGARGMFLFGLLAAEAMLIVAIAVAVAMATLLIIIVAANQFLVAELGMTLTFNFLHSGNILALAGVFGGAFLTSLIPAFKAYRVAVD